MNPIDPKKESPTPNLDHSIPAAPKRPGRSPQPVLPEFYPQSRRPDTQGFPVGPIRGRRSGIPGLSY